MAIATPSALSTMRTLLSHKYIKGRKKLKVWVDGGNDGITNTIRAFAVAIPSQRFRDITVLRPSHCSSISVFLNDELVLFETQIINFRIC
jgi:hypothetical protein